MLRCCPICHQCVAFMFRGWWGGRSCLLPSMFASVKRLTPFLAISRPPSAHTPGPVRPHCHSPPSFLTLFQSKHTRMTLNAIKREKCLFWGAGQKASRACVRCNKMLINSREKSHIKERLLFRRKKRTKIGIIKWHIDDVPLLLFFSALLCSLFIRFALVVRRVERAGQMQNNNNVAK